MNDLTKEELNKYLNELVRTNLRYEKKDSTLKNINKMSKQYMYVYRITNIKNNKFYIGSTCEQEPISRLKRHNNELKTNTHKNIHMQRSYNKYGDVFVYEILEMLQKEQDYYDSKKIIESIEQKYIDKTGCCNPLIGYNEAAHVHGGFNNCTWETLEKRTGIKPEKLEEYFNLLENTDLTFNEIDKKVGVNKIGLAYKIYFGYSFKELAKNREFRKRQARDGSRGQHSTSAKLNNEQVLMIIKILKNRPDVPIQIIANCYNVSRATIFDIYQKRNWHHLTLNIDFPNRKDIWNNNKLIKDSQTISKYICHDYDKEIESILHINLKDWR